MPITAQQAWDATDPSQSDEQREEAAKNILLGVAANDAYLDSRGELERLKALSQGGQVVSHASINETDPTPAVDPTTDAQTVDSTVVEENHLTAGPGGPATDETTTVDTLRKQLTDAGLTPKA